MTDDTTTVRMSSASAGTPPLTLTAQPPATTAGGFVRLTATLHADAGLDLGTYDFVWEIEGPDGKVGRLGRSTTSRQIEVQKFPYEVGATTDTTDLIPAAWTFRVRVTGPLEDLEPRQFDDSEVVQVTPRPFAAGDDVSVSMRRAAVDPTDDQALWVMIRNSTTALDFENFSRFVDRVYCDGEEYVDRRDDPGGGIGRAARRIEHRTRLPFPEVERYRVLKASAAIFVMINCRTDRSGFRGVDLDDERDRLSRQVDRGELVRTFQDYLEGVPDGRGDTLDVIPYLALIRRKLGDVPVLGNRDDDAAAICYGIIASKLQRPCYLELIWAYWMECSGLVRAMDALLRRFQNRPSPRSGPDPLAGLDVDPLRPLNNILWGLVQDRQHLLTAERRDDEYRHQYGLSVRQPMGPVADSRTRFLRAFHNLLAECMEFYGLDDNTVYRANGFNVLNALKEVHLTLVQGAHNAYGDLPSTVRQEFLVMQSIIGSQQMREFLPSRTMVDQPLYLDHLDAFNKLLGRPDIPALHFRDLAVYGEQLLLSIRFGVQTAEANPVRAVNWARYWRIEVYHYCHAYRAVTGQDIARRAGTPLNGFAGAPAQQHVYRG